jgi:hypothetical protein
MSNFTFAAIVWTGLGLHLAAGIVAIRTEGSIPLVPALNLISAACVVAYWANRWFGYLFRGITWYASDQLIPLYAILVCVLAGVSLTGRYPAVTLNWVVFAFHVAVFVAAALFVTFFRMNRLF